MDGAGTKADPYHIRTAADLELLSGEGYASYRGTGVYFSLENNIDFEGAGFTPIGTTSYTFNGQFRGNNHVISNMTITSSSGNTGFFKYLATRSGVDSLIFRNCTVTDTSSTGYAGMLTGRIYGSYTVTLRNIETDNCTITASGPNAGGLVGQAGAGPVLSAGNRTYFYNCYVHDGSVHGSKYVGGIAGYGIYSSTATSLHNLIFDSCTVARMVVKGTTTSADLYVGGFLGYMGGNNTGITLTDCKVADSCVMSAGYTAGGLVGYSGSTSTVTYIRCTVDSTLVTSTGRIAGGLIGWVYTSTNVILTDCSVTRCTVKGTQQVGGIIGRLNESSSTTYTITNPVIKNNYIGGSAATASAVGGLIGYDAAAS